MKKILSIVAAVALFASLSSNLSAAEENWRTAFISALEGGKTAQLPNSKEEGLAYTPSEEIVLKDAISKAMAQKAPACECMKIAVDLEYNPYSVLKNIYASGGDLKLDQLCMCATEAGIMKAIIAKAAVDALSPTGDPLFNRDEITQSQCLGGEEGLAYTPPEEGLPYTTPAVPLSAIGTDTGANRNFATSTTL